MPDCTYNGASIFGQFNRISGPTRGYRAQRSQLPSVNGQRVYRLGKDPQVWIVRGRLISTGIVGVRTLYIGGLALQDGQTRAFIDHAGVTHNGCILSDYRTIGPYQTIVLSNGSGAATVVVQGTIEQLSPDV